MTERKITWGLLPIHPFTDRQAQIIEAKLEGKSLKQIADKLGISVRTIKHYIGGTDNNCYTDERLVLGITGIIEKETGKRPTRDNWITPLIGDVVFPFEEYTEE